MGLGDWVYPILSPQLRLQGCEDDGVDLELIGVRKLVVSDDDGDVWSCLWCCFMLMEKGHGRLLVFCEQPTNIIGLILVVPLKIVLGPLCAESSSTIQLLGISAYNGGEVITRMTTSMDTKKMFYTNSNRRDFLQRIPRVWTHHLTTILFFGFGLWTLWEGFSEKGDEDDLAEVEAKLGDDDLKKQKRPFLTSLFSPSCRRHFPLHSLGNGVIRAS
ncbi:hypothetical protein MKW98_005678 [Papaver atlanticum]|uniref:Uncharacterized protein n=1 Tax=Papaver atlanticum TaxID=357466 RepID=A0AAD4SMI9_9MAGN|nr:hypothetical protein MKW98_005678 [Papaver atlanticum]